MVTWTVFPHAEAYVFDTTRVQKNWGVLHAADAEPCPSDPHVLKAWALFHSGKFQEAALAGLDAGSTGITVANKATCIYANYLEPKEKNRLDMLLQVAERAKAQAKAEPDNANAYYWQAYALGRYSQGISVVKALAQGLGTTVKTALEKAISLSPKHADAHLALGAFHAEVIDKVGSMVAGMTYGAKKELGMQHFAQALKLTPHSPIAMIEYANGLVLLEGQDKLPEATELYKQAARCRPQDAMEQLHVDVAQDGLEN